MSSKVSGRNSGWLLSRRLINKLHLGCTLVEVNIAGNSPGDVGFWNSHFRVGGAAGSKVQTNCGGPPANCKAAYALLHLTTTSSAYIENMWGTFSKHIQLVEY